jgi:hypothetical protein
MTVQKKRGEKILFFIFVRDKNLLFLVCVLSISNIFLSSLTSRFAFYVNYSPLQIRKTCAHN